MIKSVCRSLFLTIMMIILLNTTKTLASEKFLFLNYDQFEKLTQVEQKLYVQTIQNIILQFEEQQDLSPNVLLKYKMQFLFENIFPESKAQVVESSRIRSNDPREENAKISIMLVFLNSYIEAAQKQGSETLKDTVKETFLDTYNRLEILSKKNLTNEQKINFNKNFLSLKTNYSQASKIIPDLKKIKITPLQFEIKTNNTYSDKTKKNEKNSLTIRPTDSQVQPKAKCIYSGFVIKAKKCSALTELPDELRLSEIQKSEFRCNSKDEILCNPLVFGYQNDLSPYCIRRSPNASKNCQQASNNTDNLNRIHKSWKNPANKIVFESYQKDLQQLCDSENNSSDVTSTCKVVVAQFNEVVKKEFPAALAEKKSSSGKSLRTN